MHDSLNHQPCIPPFPHLPQAGKPAEAIAAYQAALAISLSAPLVVHLNLANIYMGRGQPQYAADVCCTALSAHPRAATAWLTAALASLALGDVAAADLALTEANLLDPTNPRVWGYLALTALRAGRLDECKEALKWADKAGLYDINCILQLATGYKDAGLPHAREEQAMLMRLLPADDVVEGGAGGGGGGVKAGSEGVVRMGEGEGPRGLRQVGARISLARSFLSSQEWVDAERQMVAARVLAVSLRGVAESGALDLLCRELEEVEGMHMG